MNALCDNTYWAFLFIQFIIDMRTIIESIRGTSSWMTHDKPIPSPAVMAEPLSSAYWWISGSVTSMKVSVLRAQTYCTWPGKFSLRIDVLNLTLAVRLAAPSSYRSSIVPLLRTRLLPPTKLPIHDHLPSERVEGTHQSAS